MKEVHENTVQFRFDAVKWVVALLLIIAGIAADHHFSSVAWAIRAAIGIVLLVIVIFILAQTATGHAAWEFFKSARTELRKVVWPTRPEAVQTTLIVAAMVIAVSLILWGVDSLFLWLISLVTG